MANASRSLPKSIRTHLRVSGQHQFNPRKVNAQTSRALDTELDLEEGEITYQTIHNSGQSVAESIQHNIVEYQNKIAQSSRCRSVNLNKEQIASSSSKDTHFTLNKSNMPRESHDSNLSEDIDEVPPPKKSKNVNSTQSENEILEDQLTAEQIKSNKDLRALLNHKKDESLLEIPIPEGVDKNTWHPEGEMHTIKSVMDILPPKCHEYASKIRAPTKKNEKLMTKGRLINPMLKHLFSDKNVATHQFTGLCNSTAAEDLPGIWQTEGRWKLTIIYRICMDYYKFQRGEVAVAAGGYFRYLRDKARCQEKSKSQAERAKEASNYMRALSTMARYIGLDEYLAMQDPGIKWDRSFDVPVMDNFFEDFKKRDDVEVNMNAFKIIRAGTGTGNPPPTLPADSDPPVASVNDNNSRDQSGKIDDIDSQEDQIDSNLSDAGGSHNTETQEKMVESNLDVDSQSSESAFQTPEASGAPNSKLVFNIDSLIDSEEYIVTVQSSEQDGNEGVLTTITGEYIKKAVQSGQFQLKIWNSADGNICLFLQKQ